MADDRSVLDRAGRSPDEVIAYGDDADQRIDVLRPDDAPARVVALLHGGYWRPQWDRAHLAPMAEQLATEGCLVASIEYRRVPGDPDAMTDDVRTALRTIAETLGAPIVLVGFSAGGQLALWCAAQPDLASLLAHVVALAPVADLAEAETRDLDEGAVRAFLGSPARQREDLDPMQRSPLVRVHLLHDPEDGLVPVALSQAYAARHGATLDSTTGGHFALIDPAHVTWSVVGPRIRGDAGTMPS